LAPRTVVVPAAILDIEDIHRFIADNSGLMTANAVVDELEGRIAGLATAPERGNIPKELAAMGRADYRELHFKPYRIFYKVSKSLVVVMAVLDGRRDMNTLLRQRLTR
jgi:toxin ParE1/3/4